MPVRVVESKQNARLKELRKALSSPGRGPGALVGIEGPNLIEEALRAGLRVKTIFVAQGPDRVSERLVDALSLPAETEILQLPKKLLDQALATESPQPIAALIEPPNWSWSHVLNQNGEKTLVLVLAGIQDPGNLGTILRSAEAFGATGVVSLPGTVSAWNAKAVRASAGSIFRVPLLTVSEAACLARLREAGVKIWATKSRGAKGADHVELSGPLAFVIGNEGNGVPEDLVGKADGAIMIPCPGPVESLNAAIAASVLLYEASRQRSAANGAASKNRGARR
jgi:RNA methyltransferase, TrmH family